MRYPILFATGAATLLIALGAPALGMKLTSTNASILPTSTSARQVADALVADFPIDPSRSVETVAIGATPSELAGYSRTLKRLSGAALVTPPQRLDQRTAVIDAISTGAASSSEAQKFVKQIRALPVTFEADVGGPTAGFVDLKASLGSHLIDAALLVVCTTLLAIFLLTGSVVLAFKTLLMNVLTCVAALGVLVLVFQDGHLQGLLGYPSPGAVDVGQPILLVAVIFGLSTDYGVFLIDRIRENHDNGLSNEESVALGLERTGRITTAAALLFCVAIGALITSRIVGAREVSLGTAAAVLLDATVVRALLVPALMRMLGEWNWWSPAPLHRLWARRWDRRVSQPPRSSGVDSPADVEAAPDVEGAADVGGAGGARGASGVGGAAGVARAKEVPELSRVSETPKL
jgi:RND superfamily putative drug exporter